MKIEEIKGVVKSNLSAVTNRCACHVYLNNSKGESYAISEYLKDNIMEDTFIRRMALNLTLSEEQIREILKNSTNYEQFSEYLLNCYNTTTANTP